MIARLGRPRLVWRRAGLNADFALRENARIADTQRTVDDTDLRETGRPLAFA